MDEGAEEKADDDNRDDRPARGRGDGLAQ